MSTSCGLLGYNTGMNAKLSDEQRRALDRKTPDEPLQVDDDVTQTQYVLIRLDVFQRMQGVTYEDGDPDPRDFYPAFHAAVKDDIDAPGMEVYDNYDSHKEA